jgi:hypothetical protein
MDSLLGSSGTGASDPGVFRDVYGSQYSGGSPGTATYFGGDTSGGGGGLLSGLGGLLGGGGGAGGGGQGSGLNIGQGLQLFSLIQGIMGKGGGGQPPPQLPPPTQHVPPQLTPPQIGQQSVTPTPAMVPQWLQVRQMLGGM